MLIWLKKLQQKRIVDSVQRYTVICITIIVCHCTMGSGYEKRELTWFQKLNRKNNKPWFCHFNFKFRKNVSCFWTPSLFILLGPIVHCHSQVNCTYMYYWIRWSVFVALQLVMLIVKRKNLWFTYQELLMHQQGKYK